VLAGLIVPAGTVQAETLEEVEKKITELTTKHKSVELKMKTKMDVAMEQMSEKSEADSTVIYAKKGEKWLSRNETKSTGTRKVGEQPEEKLDSKMLVIYDGQHTYTLMESPQFTQASKQKTESQDPFGNKMWEGLHKHMNIKLLPDQTVDGKSTWVIEMRPKADEDAPPEAMEAMNNTRSVVHYRKSDGVAVKSVTYDKDKPTVTMTVTDIKYDVEPKPDTFTFKAPEGVTVMDMDALAAGQNAQSAGGDSKTASDTSEPAKATDEPKEEDKPQEEAKAEEKPKEEPKKEKGVKGLLRKLR
jgi:outer membrane lipoprotein-sorting protein